MDAQLEDYALTHLKVTRKSKLSKGEHLRGRLWNKVRKQQLAGHVGRFIPTSTGKKRTHTQTNTVKTNGACSFSNRKIQVKIESCPLDISF